MTLTEKIFSHVEHLPESYQVEVLDFVEFLEIKSKKLPDRDDGERLSWSRFSLVQAIRGMEDEEDLYSLSDVEEAG